MNVDRISTKVLESGLWSCWIENDGADWVSLVYRPAGHAWAPEGWSGSTCIEVAGKWHHVTFNEYSATRLAEKIWGPIFPGKVADLEYTPGPKQ